MQDIVEHITKNCVRRHCRPAGPSCPCVKQSRQFVSVEAFARAEEEQFATIDVRALCTEHPVKGSETHVRTVSIEPVRSLCSEPSRSCLYSENCPGTGPAPRQPPEPQLLEPAGHDAIGRYE